jgi:hypothetical protein
MGAFKELSDVAGVGSVVVAVENFFVFRGGDLTGAVIRRDYFLNDTVPGPFSLSQNNRRGNSTSGSSIVQSSGCRSSLYGIVRVKSSTRVGVSKRVDGRPPETESSSAD